MLFFFMLIINPITHQIQSYYQFFSILYKTKLNKLNYEFDKAKLNKLNYELICFVCSAFYVGNFLNLQFNENNFIFPSFLLYETTF